MKKIFIIGILLFLLTIVGIGYKFQKVEAAPTLTLPATLSATTVAPTNKPHGKDAPVATSSLSQSEIQFFQNFSPFSHRH